MNSSRRCDIFYRSDAMSTIRVAAEKAATRMECVSRSDESRCDSRSGALKFIKMLSIGALNFSAPIFFIAATR